MKTLKAYIKERGVSAMAADLGVTKGLVSHWMNDRQRPSPQMANRIEAVTKGVVSRESVRPDIFTDVESTISS